MRLLRLGTTELCHQDQRKKECGELISPFTPLAEQSECTSRIGANPFDLLLGEQSRAEIHFRLLSTKELLRHPAAR